MRKDNRAILKNTDNISVTKTTFSVSAHAQRRKMIDYCYRYRDFAKSFYWEIKSYATYKANLKCISFSQRIYYYYYYYRTSNTKKPFGAQQFFKTVKSKVDTDDETEELRAMVLNKSMQMKILKPYIRKKPASIFKKKFILPYMYSKLFGMFPYTLSYFSGSTVSTYNYTKTIFILTNKAFGK